MSLYTLTKGISAGVYLVAWLLMAIGALEADSALWRWFAPLAGLAFMGVTGVLLIWDLEHPERFHYIFLRPQWKSWLVRGGFILSGYGAILTLHLVAAYLGRSEVTVTLAWAGVPLALMAAVYTAYLFAQAKARDLWQSALLPPHLAIQAIVAGAAALLLAIPGSDRGAQSVAQLVLAGATLVHLLMVAGEISLPHPTTHARLAVREMTAGHFRNFFRAGIVLGAAGLLAPWLGPAVGLVALVGLLAYEHAFVQAGQSVPLA